MENLRKGGFAWWTVAVVAVGMLTCAVSQPPQLFKVGGRDGWTKDVNYTEWAIHQRLYVGDWLCKSLFLSQFIGVYAKSKLSECI